MGTFQQDQVQDIYYLSPMQEGMLFHTLLHPEQSYYVEQMSIPIKGPFQVDLLEQSVQRLCNRHDIFRTVFIHEKVKRPVQVVLRERDFSIRKKDISHLAREEQERIIKAYKQQDRETGFDLSKDVLMRMAVFITGREEYIWIWSYHHILLDGWCLGKVISELFHYYESSRLVQPISLTAVKPYKEYIKWLQTQDKKPSLAYWKAYLDEFEGQITFKEQRRRGNRAENSAEEYISGEVTFVLGEEDTFALHELASQHSFTINTAIQAAWAILLSRYHLKNDVIFGTIVSGRPVELEGVEAMIGPFINVVPTRVRFNQESSFLELVTALQEQVLQAERHQYIPFYEIKGSQADKAELIDHLIVFENYPFESVEDENGQRLGFQIGRISVFERTNYDLNILVMPGKKLTFQISYNQQIYPTDFIQRIKDQWLMVVKQAARQPKRSVAEMSLVTEIEQQKEIAREQEMSNNTTWLSGKLPVEQFGKQVQKHPNKIALITEEQRFTYRELNNRANQLALALNKKGIGPGSIVGLLFQRGWELVVSIWATVKQGAAYLPIDPDYPLSRMRYMVEDAQASLLLTDKKQYSKGLELLHEEAVFVAEEGLFQPTSCSYTGVEADPDHIAYIVYTSGTTGLPKGVGISQRNMAAFCEELKDFGITSQDTLLSLSPYTFDGFIIDLFGAMLHGAKLFLPSKETILQLERLGQIIVEEKVSVMFVTTALFNLLIDEERDFLQGIRLLLFGGERASLKHARKAIAKLPYTRLFHVYGPTEGTVCATSYEINQLSDEMINLPIGKPLSYTSSYVLGPGNCLQPLGAPGELCLGGLGLASGYLNRPELTAEKFIPHPFISGARLYRTGDIVRLLPDGNLEFLERSDHQVKIRGHRIELGEIESCILTLEKVKEAVVRAITNDQGHVIVTAYVVKQHGMALQEGEIRSFLEQVMPDYMLPQFYFMMEQLPLNQNGKINDSLLPTPTAQSTYSTKEAGVPRNTDEARMASLWANVLGVTSIGIYDNFFERGGHSLKVMLLCSQIQKEYGVSIPIRQVFENPNVAATTLYVQSQKQQHAYEPLLSLNQRDYYETSSPQKRMYIVSQYKSVGKSYHIPVMYWLEGNLNVEALRQAFQQLIDRHEPLRTSFAVVQGEIVQRVEENVSFPLLFEQIDEHKLDLAFQYFEKPLDLHQSPLMRAGLFQTKPEHYLFILELHHIIADGISVAILLQELFALYQGEELAPLSIQYKEYADWSMRFRDSALFLQQEQFWLSLLKEPLPTLALPMDFPRPAIQQFQGKQVSTWIDEELTALIHKRAAENGVTLHMFLYAVYNLLLYKYTGQHDFIVGVPIAGRAHPDVPSMVGMFVNTLAIRCVVHPHDDFRTFLTQVRDRFLDAYDHQDYPLEMLIEKLGLARDLGRNPLFDTLFGMQNSNDWQVAQLRELRIVPFEAKLQVAQFDLALKAEERQKRLLIQWEYAVHLFKTQTITMLSQDYLTLLQDMLANLDQPLQNVIIKNQPSQLANMLTDTIEFHF
ncbi:non-ribosomal peptide synthetase [Brevibacillus laterosporus]|uniref:non-ribosomal peptide synthetase n=1 Tax=Brevibacillus laterosporus TaxID=1465 RepID=UPI002653AA24|nr:non-ribosomal peptide synthetase [Brevibacillus laterosporus]MDN9009953.1 amino acid adenylation domain-containing protein [Brevibacillus laterosporus]MDO0940665.1 amino acid adenylation domain-containing protein [Brevibacillus laterosporus]